MVRIDTERLRLRPFRSTDAGEFARLAGDWAVASMTSDIPYPFSRRQAFAWLAPMRGEVRFAIEREGQLIGGAGFYRRASGTAELGFWLGKPWWGQGYATEAARAVLREGLKNRRLPGYSSAHFVDNPASERVLRKLGFVQVGRARIACNARGCDVDAITYWLDRKQAQHTLQEMVFKETPRSRWRAWLDRLEL
jgi:[ribosomal protein S5]-alanine N-acetyltransferase